MFLSLYHDKTSLLHRVPAGWKLLFLMVSGTALFAFEDIVFIGAFFLVVSGLYAIARIPPSLAFRQIKPILFLLAAIFGVQLYLSGLLVASVIVIRFAALILTASLVTLTTRTTELIDSLEFALRPFGRFIALEKVSLAISMTIRFIPLIMRVTEEVKEAQRTRGLERSVFAVAMPVVIRTLQRGEQIAEAIEARSFDSDETESDETAGTPR